MARTTAKDREDPEVGRRLSKKREECGLTQKDMAKELKMTVQGYQNYEYGKEISSGRLIQICAVLECSPNWLLGYHDEGMQLAPDSLLLHQLRAAFGQLNDVGQQEAVKRVEDLTYNPVYTEKKSTSASAEA